ncbi:MAG: PAS domain S-box protein [Cardiobacteriaceae bacterium]|nr:PAS domain S-box protein [Cardiobacteriaceae bacterium]
MHILTDMVKPEGKSTRHELQYYDGNQRVVYTVDEPLVTGDGVILISRTDAAGIITHANRGFIEVSGYRSDELIGAPHYIIRHPDMPKGAFQDLWKTIQQGLEWHGYVKNLRKDGRYYWVYATVAPVTSHGMLVGSTSVRRKVDEKTIAKYEMLYREMRSQERQESLRNVQNEPQNEGVLGKLFGRKK